MSGEILFLAHRFPYPPDRGDKIRSWHMLKALTDLAPVHLCTLVDDLRDLDHLAFVESYCASVATEARARSKLNAMVRSLVSGQSASVEAFGSAALQMRVDALLKTRPIATIFVFSGQMAQFVPQNLGQTRFVMDFVDVDSAKFAAYADQSHGFGAIANQFEARRLAAFEKRIAQRADISLLVSEDEAALFRQTTGLDAGRVRPLENGIDLARFKPDADVEAEQVGEGPLLVFTGQMDYRPNIDAVAAFVHETLPLIHKVDPKVRFAIVGRAPTAEVEALANHAGVIVTGEVPDTRTWLAAADLVVAPLKLARGIQNKVLEAMAMGVPVLASPAAAQGIDAAPDDGLIVATTSKDEAQGVIAILSNAERREKLGTAARRRMQGRYSWGAQLAGLEEIVFPRLLERAA